MVSLIPFQRDTSASIFLETIKMVPVHPARANPDLKVGENKKLGFETCHKVYR